MYTHFLCSWFTSYTHISKFITVSPVTKYSIFVKPKHNVKPGLFVCFWISQVCFDSQNSVVHKHFSYLYACKSVKKLFKVVKSSNDRSIGSLKNMKCWACQQFWCNSSHNSHYNYSSFVVINWYCACYYDNNSWVRQHYRISLWYV